MCIGLRNKLERPAFRRGAIAAVFRHCAGCTPFSVGTMTVVRGSLPRPRHSTTSSPTRSLSRSPQLREMVVFFGVNSMEKSGFSSAI